MRALISVYDKAGVDAFARGLADLGWEIVSSGGTAAYLEELGIEVQKVEDVTQAPEMLEGRVKTLHPRIHAGILARRDRSDDVATLDEHEIEPFDLVCVNLYPFAQVVARRGVQEDEAVEVIDIGGPSMLRAAAKNFAHVAPLCRSEQYGPVLDELRATGGVSLDTRRRLATDAFATTAAYEAAIARWFSELETFPHSLIPAFTKVLELSYGENPHQRAAYYAESGARMHLLSRVERLSGKELSYNNLNDLSAARLLLREFTLPACVIVKHANPCGVAVAETVEEAYAKALASDPVAAYGGVVVAGSFAGALAFGFALERGVRGLVAHAAGVGRDGAGISGLPVAMKFSWFFGTRTIWMDGRPHPPDYAAHTWQGFSTGRWAGRTLTVETSHIKVGTIQRNGVPASVKSKMTEYFIRHGTEMTITERQSVAQGAAPDGAGAARRAGGQSLRLPAPQPFRCGGK